MLLTKAETAAQPDQPADQGADRLQLGPDAQALILFNPKAGSVNESDRDKLIAAVTEAGITRYALVGAEMMSAGLFERAKNFDVIIVLGGDGTANSVLELAPANAPPMVLLPGGTLNVLPRALYGELAWPAALAAGTANGKPFYIAAIFGAPTLLARAREAVREGDLIKAVSRARHFMKRAFSHRLTARPDRKRAKPAEAIGVLCPSFSGTVEGSDLEWVRLETNHLLDLARVSLRAIGEGWRKDPTIEIARCTHGDIRSSGVIPAVLDGEPKTFLSYVRIAYDPNGPLVVALPEEV